MLTWLKSQVSVGHMRKFCTSLRTATDSSFVPKSGKKTYGCDRFWNSLWPVFYFFAYIRYCE
jgi:hypothetical protein